MIDTNVLLSILLARCSGIKGIDKEVLQNFLKQTNLTLRPDHFNFLLNYGGSSDIFTSMFGDCTFQNLRERTLEKEENLGEDIPENCTYFGDDFNDELLCIENITGHIYVYGFGELNAVYYKNITSFLLYALLFNIEKSQVFNSVAMNVKVDSIEEFMLQYQEYKLVDLETYYFHFYLINKKLYALNFRNNLVNIYE